MKKTTTTIIALLMMGLPLFGQTVEQKKKMEDENLVPATVIVKGHKIEGYMQNIKTSVYDETPYEQLSRLLDEFKFLPKDSFDTYDKIRRKMYVEYGPDNCDGFIFNGKYSIDAVPNVGSKAPLIGKLSSKNRFMARLSKGAFNAYCIFTTPQLSPYATKDAGKNKYKTLIANNTPEVYIHNPHREYPSLAAEVNIAEEFAMYPEVLRKYKAGKYNTGRTAAENKTAFGFEVVFANRKVETILNIIEDINSGMLEKDEVLPRSPFGFPAHAELMNDSLLLSLNSRTIRPYRIVGADDNGSVIRIATLTKVKNSASNMYELPIDVLARIFKSKKTFLLYRIMSYDKTTEKCVDAFEALFDENGKAVADDNKTVADLARMYPTLLKESGEPFMENNMEWRFDVASQRYYGFDPKERFGSNDRFKHPSRTDKFARYSQTQIDYNEGMTTTLFSDDETRDNDRAYYYGYELFLTTHKGDIVSRKKFDFEFARSFKESFMYQDENGRNIGQIIVLKRESVRKHPVDSIEQRLTFIVAPYDGSEPYSVSTAAMRKYDKGAEHIYGAMGIGKDVYVLYGSYTRGEENGVKEKPNKIGFVKLSTDGNATDLAVVGMDDIDESILNILGSENKSIRQKKVDMIGALSDRTKPYWYEFAMPTQSFTTQTKRIFVGYRQVEQNLPAGTPETVKKKKYFTDLYVYTCDKETGMLEKVNVIYEAPSLNRRPIKIYDIDGDNFKIQSFIDNKNLLDFKEDPFATKYIAGDDETETEESDNSVEDVTVVKKKRPFGIAGIIEIERPSASASKETAVKRESYPAYAADGAGMMGVLTITTFENGIATATKNAPSAAFCNCPMVNCSDGTTYLITPTKKVKKSIELEERKAILPLGDNVMEIEDKNGFCRLENVRYLDLKKIDL